MTCYERTEGNDILSIDDFDVFKGIELKLKAYQTLLREHPKLVESIVLLQICNPARAKTKTWKICEGKCTG